MYKIIYDAMPLLMARNKNMDGKTELSKAIILKCFYKYTSKWFEC